MNGKRLAAALCALAIVGASAGGLPLDGLDDLAIRAVAEVDPNTFDQGTKFDGSASINNGGTVLNADPVAKTSIEGAYVTLDPDTREVVSITIYDYDTYDEETITDLSDFDITYGLSRTDVTSDVPTEPGTYYAYVTAKNESTNYQGTAVSGLFLVYPQGLNGTFADGKGTWKIEGTVLTLSPAPGEKDVAIPGDFSQKVNESWMNSGDSSTNWLNLSGITKIVISDGITSIGSQAFYDVQAFLSSITIASSVKSIGGGAFQSGELSSVTFISPTLSAGDTQTLSMGSYAIGGPSTATVTISGDSAKLFYSDDGTDVAVATGASLLALYNGDLAWKVPPVANPTGTFDNGKGTWEFDQNTGTLNIRPTNEGGTAAIPTDLDYDVVRTFTTQGADISAITAIVISDGITSIGEEAIYNTPVFQASSVTIAGSVTSIAARAIGCNSITSITFNSPELAKGGQQQLSMESHAFEVSDNATFQINSSADPPVKLYDGEYEMDGQALKGSATMYGGNLTWKKPAPYLTGTFDDGKGTWEFYEESKKLIIRPTDEENGTAAIPHNYSFNDVPKAQSQTIVIKNGITEIGMFAFNDWTSLKNVTIADSVKIINDAAFSYCSELETVEMGTGLTEICWHAFYSCKKLNSITMPSSLTTIKDGAFGACTSLRSVEFKLPADTVDAKTLNISARAFSGTSSELITVDYSSSGDYRLYYNDGTKDVFIDKVSQIGSGNSSEVFILGWKVSPPDPTYTVTIPSDLTINPTTYKGEAVVSATFANITTDKPLNVTVTSKNGFNLKTDDGSSIPYTLKKGVDPNFTDVTAESNNVLTVTDANGEATSTLTFEVNPNDVYAGTYTDTLTFSISLGNSGS